MNKLNLASKRELNPCWIFLPHFFAKGDVYLWAVCLYKELWAVFWHVLWQLHWFQGDFLPLCKSSLLQTRTAEDSQGPLWTPERMDSQLGWGLAFFTSSSFHVLVGCPQNGHRLCHCARIIVLSFMLLLLLLNYDMWLLFLLLFFVWML